MNNIRIPAQDVLIKMKDLQEEVFLYKCEDKRYYSIRVNYYHTYFTVVKCGINRDNAWN